MISMMMNSHRSRNKIMGGNFESKKLYISRKKEKEEKNKIDGISQRVSYLCITYLLGSLE